MPCAFHRSGVRISHVRSLEWRPCWAGQ
jgi:hypothetical protein